MTPNRNDFPAFLVGFLLPFLLWFLPFLLWFISLGPRVIAVDLSTDPYDGETSASYVQPASEAEASDPAPDSGAADASVSYEYDYYDDEEDVVVSRAQLEAVVALLNDLSEQLALYAAEVPAGYEPTEDDLAYRADLLETLSAISDNLTLLTAPPTEGPVDEPEAEEVPEADASSPADASAPAESSAPAETDPADSSEVPADSSGSSSLVDDSISEQDFYKLVLALLLVIAFLPFVGWVYKFISSFFPV